MTSRDSEGKLILERNNSRISGDLLDMYQSFTDSTDTLSSTNSDLKILNSTPDTVWSNSSSANMVPDSSGTKVLTRITAENVDSLVPVLSDMGFEVTGSAPQQHFVEGFMPIARIPELDSESLVSQGLMGVISAPKAVTNVGLVTSQADFVEQADRVRASLPIGYDGTGVRIGVLSDSYNVSRNGSAEADIASGDLPANGVTVLEEGRLGDTDEGRAMLQLVHDLAPGSDLAFSTVDFGEADFAQQIRNLADPNLGNAKILVDDVGYLTEPFFQDGVATKAIDDVVTNLGVAYFSAAGNNGRQSYESTNFAGAPDSAGIFAGTFHNFDSGTGVDTRQLITIPPNGTINFDLQWDDPFYTTNGVKTDLDFLLVQPGTDRILARSTNNNILNQTPQENFGVTNLSSTPLQAEVMIQLVTGPEPGRIKYINFGTPVTFNDFDTSSPTVVGHAAAVNGLAVAAADYYNQDKPADFTSAGPTTIFFSPDGTRLATPETRLKPEVTAIDGTDTTFFNPNSIDIDRDGFPNFFGTSAAAPHAAAIAALVKQANPDFTPAQIYERLESTAKDIGTPGRDDLTGFGLIDAYKAVFGSVVPASVNFSDDFEDGTLPIAFETNTTGAGRIRVTGDGDPLGTRHVTLDSSVNGLDALDELILHVNAAEVSGVTLSFDEKRFGNNQGNRIADTFTGSVNGDGVSLSVDGANWFRLFDLAGANSSNRYENKTIDLSEFAADKGLTLGSDVRIKFQEFGNQTFPNGGFAFDNISVFSASNENTPPVPILLG